MSHIKHIGQKLPTRSKPTWVLRSQAGSRSDPQPKQKEAVRSERETPIEILNSNDGSPISFDTDMPSTSR